jgi:hypothetical protein
MLGAKSNVVKETQSKAEDGKMLPYAVRQVEFFSVQKATLVVCDEKQAAAIHGVLDNCLQISDLEDGAGAGFECVRDKDKITLTGNILSALEFCKGTFISAVTYNNCESLVVQLSQPKVLAAAAGAVVPACAAAVGKENVSPVVSSPALTAR